MLIPRESYVVVTERDCGPDGVDPQGPLVGETYLPKTLEEARKRAASLGMKYGWAIVCRIVPVDPETGEDTDATD